MSSFDTKSVIDVEIAGQSPFELMPLGALPYAMWAEKALQSFQKVVPNAYAKVSKVYMGCLH